MKKTSLVSQFYIVGSNSVVSFTHTDTSEENLLNKRSNYIKLQADTMTFCSTILYVHV